MTATDRDHRPRPAPVAAGHRPAGAGMLWSDTLVFARRNIEHVRQIPEKLLDVTIQPIMFVLLFGFVFGGAIASTAATTASSSSAASSSRRWRSA